MSSASVSRVSSTTLNEAVPVPIAVTGQKCVAYVELYEHATGVVADPPTRASAAAEAQIKACFIQS